MKDERKKAEQDLTDSHARWEHIYKYGAGDPNWEDGCNLNLVRNHILIARRKLEALEYFPEIYNREVPPKIEPKYMARADEIRENAKQSLTMYYKDEDYKYLVQNCNQVSKREADSICLYNVIGYVTGLEKFIKEDNLVRMRLHEKPERYIESFKTCHDRLNKILADRKMETNDAQNFIEEQNGQLRFV